MYDELKRSEERKKITELTDSLTQAFLETINAICSAAQCSVGNASISKSKDCATVMLMLNLPQLSPEDEKTVSEMVTDFTRKLQQFDVERRKRLGFPTD